MSGGTAVGHARRGASTAAPAAPAPTRLAIEVIHPIVDSARFTAKASVVEPVDLVADVYADGHEHLAASATFRHLGFPTETTVDLTPIGNDRWTGRAALDRVGRWEFTVTAWLDPWDFWRHAIALRRAAGADVTSDIADGERLLARAAAAGVAEAAAICDGGAAGGPDAGSPDVAADLGLAAAMRAWAATLPGSTTTPPLPLEVARERAAYGAWYELFPRSTVVGSKRQPGSHGTFDDLIGRLDHVADLRFDVVYLPPIHPIGVTARKGPENRLVAEPGDPGSPWAIGAADGGHTAVHPDLGTVEDFDRVVAAANERGLEIALDLAFQCSPEHPWVTEHPDWFAHRADGTIRTAENPPKRYEDIYPIDFACDDWQSLWNALADVVRYWVGHGVRIFRVDNPHTKPFAFWQWMIGEIRADHPDVVFLAEAFTRPRVLERLAKVGFDQSYGYFTWKRTAAELRSYFEELDELADFLRPNVWPNTPDILTEQLQDGGRPMFEARAVLAAMLAANYGVYGPAFELLEDRPARRPSEDYAASEKYEVRTWDLESARSIAPLLRRLNEIRAAHPALHSDRRRTFHHCDDPGLLAWSKRSADGADTILTIVNVEADMTRSGMVRLDLAALGIPAGTDFEVRDLLDGATYVWHGADNYVALDPHGRIAHVFDIQPATSRTESTP